VSDLTFIEKNLKNIQKQINKRAKLIAVTKTWPQSYIQKAFEYGQVHFGENKVQELLDKSNNLSHLDIKWHFIGSLQSNKINSLLRVKNLISIHSISSIKLLNKLLSKKIDKKIGLFIQINTSGEEQKEGFDIKEDFTFLIEKINKHEFFYFQGFMTIGKIRTDNFEVEARRSFEQLVRIKQECSVNAQLSMGMSNDFKIALEYDSNWVRIGSSIFGRR
jgi:pyridoxal phosphate enzyme (YggS family)